MREEYGDIWEIQAREGPGCAVCVPTHGRMAGIDELVLAKPDFARGVRKKFPSFPRAAGRLVDMYGNVPHMVEQRGGFWLVVFPVRLVWHRRPDLREVRKCTNALKALADRYNLTMKKLLIPQLTACGLPDWETSRKVMDTVLTDDDDRFVLVIPI